MICARCGTDTNAHTVSMFNIDVICIECKEIEREHPMYDDAVRADTEAILRGDYNFPGIGAPLDLKNRQNQ